MKFDFLFQVSYKALRYNVMWLFSCISTVFQYTCTCTVLLCDKYIYLHL